MNKIQQQIFDGLVISDAHIRRPSKRGTSSLSMNVKYKGFADAAVSGLDCFEWNDVYRYDYNDKRTNKTYTRFVAHSKSTTDLFSERNRWYPNGDKIVPEDIELTPLVILWWYIGDGFLYRKSSRPNYRRIGFATDSFPVKDNERLVELLKYKLDDDNVYIEYGSKGRGNIFVARSAIGKFAKFVGLKSPIPEYEYKFDFGQYLDEDYFAKSFKTRPLQAINAFRKKHKVRELDYRSDTDIRVKEKAR